MKARAPLLLAAVAAALGACAGAPFGGGGTPVEVQEIGRSLYCNSATDQTTAAFLPDPPAVLDWQAARGITLAAADALVPATYVLVEMGTRPTGGYGIAVARGAELRGEALMLNATFIAPAPGAILTQAVSSPCALVRLPPGRYATVDVRDETGAVRTQGGPAPRTAPAS
jgi:hypothetical protein